QGRAEHADQAAQAARLDAEIAHRPAKHPATEPDQPDAEYQDRRAEHGMLDAFLIELDGGVARIRARRGNVHRPEVGSLRPAARWRRGADIAASTHLALRRDQPAPM